MRYYGPFRPHARQSGPGRPASLTFGCASHRYSSPRGASAWTAPLSSTRSSGSLSRIVPYLGRQVPRFHTQAAKTARPLRGLPTQPLQPACHGRMGAPRDSCSANGFTRRPHAAFMPDATATVDRSPRGSSRANDYVPVSRYGPNLFAEPDLRATSPYAFDTSSAVRLRSSCRPVPDAIKAAPVTNKIH